MESYLNFKGISEIQEKVKDNDRKNFEERKSSSGSDEMPASLTDLFERPEAMIKEFAQRDEKLLEEFKALQSGEGKSLK